MILSLQSKSFHLIPHQIEDQKLRRNSCNCSHCGHNSLKASFLNQFCEVAMHRKLRLTNLLLSKLSQHDSFPRKYHKCKHYRIFSKTRKEDLLQLVQEGKDVSPEKTGSQNSSVDIREKLITPFKQSKFQQSASNGFLQEIKTQINRQNKTINQLLTPRRYRTEQDEIIQAKKKQVIIKTHKASTIYNSARSIQFATKNRIIYPSKFHTAAPSLFSQLKLAEI